MYEHASRRDVELRETETRDTRSPTLTRECNRLASGRERLRRSTSGNQQSRLEVGSASDPLEFEADRVADRVMRDLMSTSATDPITVNAAAPTRITASTFGPLTDAAGPDGGELDSAMAGRIRRATGHGAPIADGIRPRIEAAFGSDFRNVRIHADSELAPQVGAVAFTHGNDIHFARGAYSPGDTTGLRVLSHELAHVVQQGGSVAPVSRLQRLMNAATFKSVSDAGKFRVRGDTVKQIDTLLIEYDALKLRGNHLNIGPTGIDRAINIVTHVREDIQLWRRSHAKDTSRSNQRAALNNLDTEAVAELQELNGIRADFSRFGLAGQLKVQDNKFKQKMEGSASSILDKLSPIIGAAIPSPGDAAEIELAVKIPVDPDTAGYVGFRITIGAERMDRTTTKVSLEAAFTGGLQVIGFVDVGLELGAFIEAQGKDPKAALQMLSWGWYRRFRESLLPREIASFMWGGSTGSVGWVRAEDWAASVEREDFDYDPNNPLSSGVGSDSTTNAFVRTGAFGAAQASMTIAELVEAEGGVRFGGGTHYDKDTITTRKQKRGGDFGQAEEMPARGKTTYLGTGFLKAEASASAGVGPFSGTLDAAVEWLTDQKTKKTRLEYLSASLSASATVPLNGELVSRLVTGAIALGPQVFAMIKKIGLMIAGKDKSGKPEGAGELLATGEACVHAFADFPREPFDPLDFSVEDAAETPSLADQLETGPSINVDESVCTLSLAIGVGKNLWDRAAPLSIDLTLNTDRSLQLDASVAALKATRSRRLMRLKWSGSWKPEVD